MAEVGAKVLGGQLKEFSADTVSELRQLMGLGTNYSATVNGEPASDSQRLSDTDFVTFQASVKGGK